MLMVYVASSGTNANLQNKQANKKPKQKQEIPKS